MGATRSKGIALFLASTCVDSAKPEILVKLSPKFCPPRETSWPVVNYQPADTSRRTSNAGQSATAPADPLCPAGAVNSKSGYSTPKASR